MGYLPDFSLSVSPPTCTAPSPWEGLGFCQHFSRRLLSEGAPRLSLPSPPAHLLHAWVYSLQGFADF